MDILNFISWIRGGRQVRTVDPAKTLIPVGLKDGRRDDDYLAGAITVEDFASLVGDPSITFVQGSLEPDVQATMSAIGGTITDSTGTVYNKYRIQGSAVLTGSNSYALLIGIVTGSSTLLRVKEDSIIIANDTNIYDTVTSTMSRFAYVADPSGNLALTNLNFIAGDNTISAPEDHWFTLVISAGIAFEATASIDFTIAVPQGTTIEFVN